MWFPKNRVPPKLQHDERGHFIRSDNRGHIAELDILIDEEIYNEVFSQYGYFLINVFENTVHYRALCWRSSKEARKMICKAKKVTFKNDNPLDLRVCSLPSST